MAIGMLREDVVISKTMDYLHGNKWLFVTIILWIILNSLIFGIDSVWASNLIEAQDSIYTGIIFSLIFSPFAIFLHLYLQRKNKISLKNYWHAGFIFSLILSIPLGLVAAFLTSVGDPDFNLESALGMGIFFFIPVIYFMILFSLNGGLFWILYYKKWILLMPCMVIISLVQFPICVIFTMPD